MVTLLTDGKALRPVLVDQGALAAMPLDATAQILFDITANQVVVGEVEESRVVKLAASMLLDGTTEVLAEPVGIADASGVARDVVLEALDSTISSKFLSHRGSALRERRHAPTFTTADMRKDIALAPVQAPNAGVPTAVTVGPTASSSRRATRAGPRRLPQLVTHIP